MIKKENARFFLKKMLKKIIFSVVEYIPNIFLPRIMKMIFFILRKKKRIGHGTYIDSSVHLIRYNDIVIGDNSSISEGSWLNANNRNKKGYAINIGNNCHLGRRCFISSGNSVIIKDYVIFAADCKLLGSSHVISDPFEPYITTGTTNNCTIEIGVNCFFGAAVVINGYVKIGHGCVVGANTFINNEDIPPFSIVVGNPARIIKRYSMVSHKWIITDSYTLLDEKDLPGEEAYLQGLTKKYPKIDIPYHAIGKDFGDLP